MRKEEVLVRSNSLSSGDIITAHSADGTRKETYRITKAGLTTTTFEKITRFQQAWEWFKALAHRLEDRIDDWMYL